MNEVIPQGPKTFTANDIFQKCKNLPANEWHNKMYYLVSENPDGSLTRAEVSLGKKESGTVVFLFKTDNEAKFVAAAVTRNESDDVSTRDEYTYM